MRNVFIYSISLLLGLSLSSTARANCIAGNCINGKGTYLYRDGSKYGGTFLHAKPHGKGTLHHKNGTIYTGDFYNGVKHGQGKLVLVSGDIYTGNFENGAINGSGKMTYHNGDTYIGTWVSGKPSGKGTYTFADGDFYEGQLLEGKFSGQGRLTRKDNSYYDGSWAENKKHGQGISCKSGTKMMQTYEYNTLVSERYHDDVNSISQSSTTLNKIKNQPILTDCGTNYCDEIQGYFKYKDGSVYTGDFKKGKGIGFGTCQYANGDKYTGGWLNHAPHGQGTMIFASGNKYTAEWVNGRPKQKTGTATPTEAAEKKSGPASSDYNSTRIFALIVGVATYQHMPSLKYTDDDAYQLYAFLKSPEGGALTDDHIKILIDDAATQQSIRKEISRLSTIADENDVVILYMSGHGVNGAFVPGDFDGSRGQIAYSDIIEALNTSNARHKLLITDACHSGSMMASARSPYSVALDNFYSAYNNAKPGTAILTSSKKEEVSLEYGGLRQGIFSHFLIKGLKGLADKDQNKLVTIAELYDYILANVKSYTAGAQHPTISGDFDRNMPVGWVR